MALICTLFACSAMLAQQSDKGGEGVPPDTFAADQIAHKLLDKIAGGLQSHNSRRMLAAFDRDGMPGYLTFQDQVETFFAQYESFRVFIRLEESSLQQDKGTATAIFQLEGLPLYGGPGMRRDSELTFEFRRIRSGWKIVDVTPRNFFS